LKNHQIIDEGLLNPFLFRVLISMNQYTWCKSKPIGAVPLKLFSESEVGKPQRAWGRASQGKI
jgi:hypothetical protein